MLQNLILKPILLIFISLLIYGFIKRNFRSLRLGLLFFLLGISLLSYFYLNQFVQFNIFQNILSQIHPLLRKLFLFIIIISGALIIIKIFDELIFNKYLLKKADIHVPPLFRDILKFTILSILILLVIRIEFGIKLTGLLTSSAIVSVIIGLALQDTLSNIIAGIVIHIEKPFKTGDWIRIGEREGEVVEINWRATRLKTLDGNYIVIPNTNISKETILNYYEPVKAHAIVFHVGIEYKTPPNLVKETLLKAIRDCHNILKEPHPIVHVSDYGDHAIQYELKIWIDDHSVYKDIKDDVMTKIWYGLKRQNIQIPFPIRTVYLHKEEPKKEIDFFESIENRKNIIKKIELFQDIPEEDISQIAESSKIKHFTKGERIIIKGEEGDSLYIIIKGQVSVSGQDTRGNIIHIRDLKEGEYFGEMSLLTGERRSATVAAQNETTVLEIGSSDILPVIKKNPNLTETLSKILAERKLLTKDILDKALIEKLPLEKEALSKNIFYKIKEFFSGR